MAITITDTVSTQFGARDLLLRQGSVAEYDLSLLFPAAESVDVTLSNGQVLTVERADGILRIAPQALGHSDVTLTATLADGTTAVQDFRIVTAGQNAYSLAVIPDTQSYTSTGSAEIRALLGEMTGYIAEQVDAMGFQQAIQVGDMTDNNIDSQWTIVRDAFRNLDGKLGYVTAIGNHDQSPNGWATDFTSNIDNYFTAQDVGAGGTYDGYDGSIRNFWKTFTAPDGTGWLVLSLEFGAPDDVLRWAGEVIEGHLDHRVILTTHGYMAGDKRTDPLNEPLTGENGGWGYGIRNDQRNVNDGEDMWRELVSKFPNTSFTFSGHNFLDGAQTQVDQNAAGGDVLQMFVNYQNGIDYLITGGGDPAMGGRAGNGAFRWVVIDPDNDRVETHTKFVALDKFFDRIDHQELFLNVDLGMPPTMALARAGEDQVIRAEAEGPATVTLDPSGSIAAEGASFVWLDARGRTVATSDGGTVTAQLDPGSHRLTLVATDAAGHVSRDDLVVLVQSQDGLLAENFNDGTADGWGGPDRGRPDFARLGSDSGFGLPSLTGEGRIPLVLSFDSHWRPYDKMTARVTVSYDGGEPVTLLRYGSDNTNDTDFRNQSVALNIDAPVSAQTVNVSFVLSDADNDWYWAIDNVTLSTADGTLLLAEDFDGLADVLQPAADENIDPSILGWTHQPPEGWTRWVDPATPQGTAEWRGWSFATMEFWTAADTQARAEFTRSSGVIAIMDPDEWDDFNGGSNGDDMNTSITTPGIDLTELGGGQPGNATGVLQVDALTADQGILFRADGLAGQITDYTLVYDILIPAGAGRWGALWQTDVANTGDAELYLRNDGTTASVGTWSVYDGAIGFGEWARVAFAFAAEDGQHVLRKFVDGVQVGGVQVLDSDLTDGSRWAYDADTGALVMTDSGAATSASYLAGFAFVPQALDAGTIAELGGVDADGIFDEAPTDGAVQFGFADGINPQLGAGRFDSTHLGQAATDFLVKGSIFGNPDGVGEAALYAQSNKARDILLWQAPEARDWADYTYQVEIHPTDNDTVGAVFYWTDSANYYELALNTEDWTRTLTRVQDGERTELAREAGGYRHHADQMISVTVVDGRITAMLDDRLLFGGPVADDAPLAGGTVGVLAGSMDRVSYDNITVNPVTLDARITGTNRAADLDGDGIASLRLSAAASVSAAGITAIEWLIDGQVVATGAEALLDLRAGETPVLLRVTDALGRVAEDSLTVTTAARSQVLLAEDFGGNAPHFTFTDTGTIAAPGDWRIMDGALWQMSDIHSPEQGAGWGAWSEQGDGPYILRHGTQAVYGDAAALGWTDYALDVAITAANNRGVGVLVRYQDEQNHYKLELDDSVGVANLLRVEDGIETVLARGWYGYAEGVAQNWHVSVEGQRIHAEIDGMRLFDVEVTDGAHAAGTVALYTWANAGVRFDDLVVTSLEPVQPALNPVLGTAGRDNLAGTDGDDLIAGMGGNFDVLTGGLGADVFYFGTEALDGVRERATIMDYEVGVDSIALGLDVTVAAIKQAGAQVVVYLADPSGANDAIYVRGEGVTVDNLTILNDYQNPLLVA